jgi:hypothetical protein
MLVLLHEREQPRNPLRRRLVERHIRRHQKLRQPPGNSGARGIGGQAREDVRESDNVVEPDALEAQRLLRQYLHECTSKAHVNGAP